MSRGSMDGYRDAWKARFLARQARLESRRTQLLAVAREAAGMLKRQFQVKDVYLIGSLARAGVVHDKQDIDLVVSGLQDKVYFKAICALHDLAASMGINDVEFDLITIETARPSVKQVVTERGVVL